VAPMHGSKSRCPSGMAAGAEAAPRALDRDLGKGVRGEGRTRSYANIEPTIRAINARIPPRRTPASSGDRSVAGVGGMSCRSPYPPG
jgi:hypothetical protein